MGELNIPHIEWTGMSREEAERKWALIEAALERGLRIQYELARDLSPEGTSTLTPERIERQLQLIMSGLIRPNFDHLPSETDDPPSSDQHG